jgi:large subunit ribosomal protein L1
MPNPKTGTVTMDVTKAVNEIKGGKITFRVDKHSNLHLIIGKASFSETQLIENYATALDEILRAKPSASKGKFLRKVNLSTTMGPGIPVDPNVTRNLVEVAE